MFVMGVIMGWNGWFYFMGGDKLWTVITRIFRVKKQNYMERSPYITNFYNSKTNCHKCLQLHLSRKDIDTNHKRK